MNKELTMNRGRSLMRTIFTCGAEGWTVTKAREKEIESIVYLPAVDVTSQLD